MITAANELGSTFIHEISRFFSLELPWFFNLTLGTFCFGVLAVNIAVLAYRFENREGYDYKQPRSHMGALHTERKRRK